MSDRNFIRAEFYRSGEDKHLAVVEVSSVPPEGAFISIRGEIWQIERITWALDHADDLAQRRLRANIDLISSYPPPAP